MHLRAFLNIQKEGEKDIYLFLVCPVLFEVLVMYTFFEGKKAQNCIETIRALSLKHTNSAINQCTSDRTAKNIEGPPFFLCEVCAVDQNFSISLGVFYVVNLDYFGTDSGMDSLHHMRN